MNGPEANPTTALRLTGRLPQTPFSIALPGQDVLTVIRLLRVLPGKRLAGEGLWQGQRVLAKLFIAADSHRHWRREHQGICALHAARLESPELLLATPLPAGGHLLLTRFIDPAYPLSETVARQDEAASPGAFLPAFRLLGRLHAARLRHEDPHPGNFLCGEGTLFLLDGDAVRPLAKENARNARQRLCNLALLLAQIPLRWDNFFPDFLAAYDAESGFQRFDTDTLRRQWQRARTKRQRDFLQKTTRDCSLFSVHQSTRRLVICRRPEEDRLAPLTRTPDLAIQSGLRLKDGRTSTVCRLEVNGQSLVVKRYNLKDRWHALARLWRPSRAWHSWRAGYLLDFLGIATPRPLALMEERLGPLRQRAFLITDFCPGISLWHHLIPDRVPEPPLAEALLALFRTLKSQRISHGDLKASNLLWHQGKIVLIDLDALVQHRSSARFERAWQRDRNRLLRNWPAGCTLYRWLDSHLP